MADPGDPDAVPGEICRRYSVMGAAWRPDAGMPVQPCEQKNVTGYLAGRPRRRIGTGRALPDPGGRIGDGMNAKKGKGG